MQTTAQLPARISIQQHLQLLLLETQALLLAFLAFIFVPPARLRAKYPVLLRTMFLVYLFPAFLFLGPHAIFLMAFYQIGFNMLLRAASHI